MGILDSDSDSDDSSSSEEFGKKAIDVGQFMNKKKASLSDYAAFKGADDDEDETTMKMKEILQLREALGMDKDVNFMAEQAKKEAEKERLAKLTPEQRMQEEKAGADDMMAKIRAKQAALKIKDDDDDADSEEEKKKAKKEKKKKKKKKSED